MNRKSSFSLLPPNEFIVIYCFLQLAILFDLFLCLCTHSYCFVVRKAWLVVEMD